MGCLALFSAVLALLAAAPSLPVLAALMIPLGIPLSPWLGSLSASVQRAVPAGSITEAFTWTFAVITVGMAAGSACGGVIIQAASTNAAFLAAGGLGLAGAAAGATRLLARHPSTWLDQAHRAREGTEHSRTGLRLRRHAGQRRTRGPRP